MTSAEAAQVLLEPRYARFLAPFLGRERLVAEVAEEVGAPLSTTYRYVTRFCDAGVLRVTREQQRGGRALKFYRTVADAFYIPNRLRTGPQMWPDEFERAAKRGLEHVYGEQYPEWGELIFRNEDGIFTASLARAPGVPVTSSPRVPGLPSWQAWQVLYEYDYDGVSLSNPRAIRAFEVDYIGHTGGGLDIDDDGNLFIGVGDDVNPHSEPSGGYAPLSERAGTFHDARETSANTNDLRGKILRINPVDEPGEPGVDSSYTIPEGNLFPESEDVDRDKILTAQQAVEYGLVDEVLDTLKVPAV